MVFVYLVAVEVDGGELGRAGASIASWDAAKMAVINYSGWRSVLWK